MSVPSTLHAREPCCQDYALELMLVLPSAALSALASRHNGRDAAAAGAGVDTDEAAGFTAVALLSPSCIVALRSTTAGHAVLRSCISFACRCLREARVEGLRRAGAGCLPERRLRCCRQWARGAVSNADCALIHSLRVYESLTLPPRTQLRCPLPGSFRQPHTHSYE
ncbi:hypothetical protein B0H19DRAFT_1261117 [Mycena capillaripes]|nr:hypothetical protein B0H19DRAFT_1261117 [Mycena capillaripes]